MTATRLDFTPFAVTAIATGLPNVQTPVFRWRKLVRRLDPFPDSNVSRLSFRAVAMALADYADRNGRRCRPSVAQLASDAGVSERTAQRALRQLEQWGILECSNRGGRGRAAEYVLRVPVYKPVQNGVVDDVAQPERVTGATLKGDTPVTPGPSRGPKNSEPDPVAAAPPVESDAPWHQLALRVCPT